MNRMLSAGSLAACLLSAAIASAPAGAQTTAPADTKATEAAAPQPTPEMLQRVRKASQAVRAKPLTKTTATEAATDTKATASPVQTSALKATEAKPATAPAATSRCTKLAFSVNDYGKEGPTNDAKSLLDKHIASWAQQKGIKKYSVGKKFVKCELFLDFGVFDEHTCTAQASVCW